MSAGLPADLVPDGPVQIEEGDDDDSDDSDDSEDDRLESMDHDGADNRGESAMAHVS